MTENKNSMLTKADVNRLFNFNLNHQIRVFIDAFIGHEILLVTASDLHPDDHLYITFEIYQMIYILHLSKMITDQGQSRATFSRIFNRILESNHFDDEYKAIINNLKTQYNKDIFSKYTNAKKLIKQMRDHYYAHNIFVPYSRRSELQKVIENGYLEMDKLTRDFIDFLHYVYKTLKFKGDFQTIDEIEATILNQKKQLGLV